MRTILSALWKESAVPIALKCRFHNQNFTSNCFKNRSFLLESCSKNKRVKMFLCDSVFRLVKKSKKLPNTKRRTLEIKFNLPSHFFSLVGLFYFTFPQEQFCAYFFFFIHMIFDIYITVYWHVLSHLMICYIVKASRIRGLRARW